MNRPYTVCHIFSGLDGAITGSFMGMKECGGALKAYGAIRSEFDASAILYGTTTMLDFCDGYALDLPKQDLADRTDFISEDAKAPFVIAIDRKGKLAYSSNCLERHGKKQHIVEVVTQKASNEYLNYLKNLGISYIFGGQSELDCRLCMQKLKSLFGIERLVIAGGGYIDWAFADAGMIDELSLVLAPAADGEDRVTVFEKSNRFQNAAITFALKDVKKLEGDGVWLRYDVKNAIK